MKVHLDSRLIRKLTSVNLKERASFFDECVKAMPPYDKKALKFSLNWPSLLTYLGIESLFDNFPKLDDQNKIFSSVVEVLKMDSEKEVVIYLYDQIFVECLTQIKGLEQIYPENLLNLIQDRYENPLFTPIDDPFLFSLESYEKKLIENPQDVMHDLVLYLAWDRVCVYIATLFDQTSLQIKNGLEILKECLIESFQHITKQGKTAPGFFRLIEALYAYEMKEENLQNYTDSNWQILCQSAVILRDREELANVCYIDAGLENAVHSDHSPLKTLTLEASDRVKSCLSLANYMLEKLRLEIPDWEYHFHSQEIICLKEEANSLSIDIVLRL